MAFGSSGNLYLCDEGGKVWKVSQNGTLSVLTDFTGERVPWGITVDGKENIYITDGGNGIFEIVKITQDGKAAPILATYNVGKNPVVNFNGPEGIAIDKTGKILYIADTYNNIIRKVVLN
jgi:sugar lactone lactonase YvrE